MSQAPGSPNDAQPDNFAGLPTRIVNPWLIGWIGVGALSIASFALRERVEWLLEWPRKLVVPVDKWVDAAIDWAAEHLDFLFAALAWVVNQPLLGLREVFAWLPWPVTIGAIVLLAHYCGGWRLALLSLVSLVYMVVVGYWEPAMLTLSMVTVAVPLSVLFALLLGVLSFSYRPVWRVVEPVLDVMQAMPAFAYLVPMLLWFGLTPMLAVLTSAIYAIPPMTRTVVLGFSRVSVEAVDAAVMSGSTRSQILWWVRFPMSLPTLLLGLNQTIMAAFALVVFASIVGGTADIGYEVLLRLRKSQFGEALLSGIVITLFAILADRISRGYAARRSVSLGRRGGGYRAQLVVALVAAVGVVVVAEFMPLLRVYPEAWVFYPADALNDAVRWFTAEFFAVTKWIKQKALFFVLFPIRSGLENAVRPHVWGFEMSATVTWNYLAIMLALAVLATRAWGWRGAMAVVFVGGLYYYGTLGTPWPAFIATVTLLAWQVGGWRIGLFSLCGWAFMLLTGIWEPAMLSVYLCGAAVIVCFLLGAGLGILAALDDRVSAFLRPINDTLQTIPLFVFLIPVLMVFLHGDFSAFLAIIMYAIVPAIRYTEHGIRNVPAEIVEAARSFGTTRAQRLFQVELPLALPEIMLGLNQVVVFALAMLIVSSLLGTHDLGQKIYEALTRAQTGKGLVAGFAIALVAMIADRIIQAWATRRKRELGLA